MKNFIVYCLIFISVLNLQCGGDKKQTAGQVEIVFWHSLISSTAAALKELLADFEKEHPNIKIRAEYIPSGDALVQKLITSIQSKNAPDISWIHADFMEDLVKADAIYKMEHFIKGPDGIPQSDIDDIYPSLLAYASWRKTLYSMPMEATNLALIYNKDMFKQAGLDPERPPQDWNELREYARKLTFDKNNDGKFDQVGLFLPIFSSAGPLNGWMVWQWMPYLWQAGGDFITEDQSKAIYNSEAGIEALTLWKDIYDELKLRSFTADFDVAFKAKHLAMAMDGPWNLPRYKTLLSDLNWAFAPLPKGPSKQATIVGGEYLAVFKQSVHPNEAWKFIKWMIKPETQAKWSMKSGYLPIRHAVLDVPEFKVYLEKNPNYKVFVDQMEVSVAQKSVDYGGLQITRHIGEALEKATVGRLSAKQALDESAAKSNKVLSEGRKNL